jgi:hypothetical protein
MIGAVTRWKAPRKVCLDEKALKAYEDMVLQQGGPDLSMEGTDTLVPSLLQERTTKNRKDFDPFIETHPKYTWQQQ